MTQGIGTFTRDALRRRFLAPLLGAAALMSTAVPSGATYLKKIITICTESAQSFDARVAALGSEGFLPQRTDSTLWVQGQVAHIAMGDLEYTTPDDPGDLPGTYKRFQDMADNGTLFLRGIQEQAFLNAEGTVALSFSLIGGTHACTLAFGREAKVPDVPLRLSKTWRSDAGSYSEYRISGGRSVHASQLSSNWDAWIPGPRLVSAFVTISEG